MGPEPMRDQIAEIIRQRIEAGVYPARRAIPAQAQLAKSFGVSRPTVRAAIEVLIKEDRLHTVRGKGTFVRAARPSEAEE